MFRSLLQEKWAAFHPLVWALFIGTVFARAATSMSLPFLALYLSHHAGLNPVMIDRMAGNRYRGTYFGANSFTSLGHFLGPFFGGFLLQHYGGTVLFTVMALITLCSTCVYHAGDAALKRRNMGLESAEKAAEG